MKKLSIALFLTIALAGVSLAQSTPRGAVDKSAKPKIAVLEFGTGANSSAMTAEAKRQLQASIAFALVKDREFEVPDVRNTRAATPAGGVGTSAAVRIGKQLGVGYVLIGTVTEYSTTAGRMTMRIQLVEVATGRAKLSEEITGQSTSQMSGNAGHAEMSAKVVKPAIQKLTSSIRAAIL